MKCCSRYVPVDVSFGVVTLRRSTFEVEAFGD